MFCLICVDCGHTTYYMSVKNIMLPDVSRKYIQILYLCIVSSSGKGEKYAYFHKVQFRLELQ